MSQYQQAPYSDNDYGNSYGNGGGSNQYGGYSDEPAAAAGNYGKYNNGGGGGEAYPMSSGNPYASAGSQQGYAKKKKNKWLWIGLPILLLIIIGAVLGGVLGTQLNKGDDNNSSGSSGSSNSGSGNANTGVPSGVSDVNTATSTGANGERYLAVATNSYMLPVYQTGTNTAGYSAPTVISNAKAAWPSDPSPPSNDSIRAHPRIGAPGYKWNALASGLIASDPYFTLWNETIINNATDLLSTDPKEYFIDGGNGVLDIAREMKERVKILAYAYRITNETRYADRAWRELYRASGNDTTSFGSGDDAWNPDHFLDVAEFCAMFAIGYDWLYEYWNDEQRTGLVNTILTKGLRLGQEHLITTPDWWTGAPGQAEVNGNWNCVINGGLTMASLAVVDTDEGRTIAQAILDASAPNARQNCFQGAESDGTWTETSDYWYFGTTGASEMVASLISAYGDDRGLSASNAAWRNTSYYHMFSQGMTSKFQWGDHGPPKFTATANGLLLWSTVFEEPRFALYQRDHSDAPEPWSMFWYDPATSGTWWDGLQLDYHFDAEESDWATGRSTWADNNGAYWAMKAGRLTGHQTHGDLDLGTFVLDAQGQRWFGELGSGQYLSTGYFSGEGQDSQRWLYYRKRTEGQNTVLIDRQNQLVTAQPSSNFGSTGDHQGAAPSFNVSDDSSAFYTVDISSGYNSTVKRGIRFLNGRKQILLQDDIANVPAGTNVQWRAHTNATSITVDGPTATLELGGQTLIASILAGPSGAVFSTAAPTRFDTDPPLPTADPQYDADVPNDGVTVLVVDNPNGGSYSLEILFNPQWSGMDASAYKTPPSVGIDNWSLTSHDN